MCIDKYPYLQWSAQISQLCEELFRVSPIIFFHYIKSYKNGSMSVLCSDPYWLDFYFKKNYYEASSFISPNGKYTERYFITSELEKSRSIVQDAVDYKIGAGIALCYPTDEYFETFLFCCDLNYQEPYQYFFNHMDTLKKFILFFRDQGYDLLQEVSNKRIILPKRPQILSCDDSTKKNVKDVAFPIKRYFIDDKTYLTKKEVQCLRYLARGVSCTEMSQICNNSVRTIETHISNIKNKLNVRRLSEIIAITKDLEII